MNDLEVEAQYEAYQKARLQSEEAIKRTSDHEAEAAIKDIHEVLLFLESAAKESMNVD
jgi:hypothetical protein